MQRTLFNEDHAAFRESAKAFVERTITPNVEKFIEQRVIDRDVWLEAGRQGLLGLEIPEEYGGSGADDYRFNTVFAEELCRVSAAVRLVRSASTATSWRPTSSTCAPRSRSSAGCPASAPAR